MEYIQYHVFAGDFRNLGAPEDVFSGILSLPALEDTQQPADSAWTGELAEGFNYLFKTVISGSVIQPGFNAKSPITIFFRFPAMPLKVNSVRTFPWRFEILN